MRNRPHIMRTIEVDRFTMPGLPCALVPEVDPVEIQVFGRAAAVDQHRRPAVEPADVDERTLMEELDAFMWRGSL